MRQPFRLIGIKNVDPDSTPIFPTPFFFFTSRLECLNLSFLSDYLEGRIEEFKKWLLARPESTICVVGHSAYFSRLCGVFLQNCQIHRMAL